MGDLEMAVAFVSRRTGRRAMAAAEWAHHLSFGLGWMAPGQAAAFVGRAQAAGILVQSGNDLRLDASPSAIDVPLGFRPDPAADAAARAVAGADPFAEWLDRVASRTGLGRPEVLASVAERQARMGGLMTAWAALLWVAADSGLDVREAARLKA